MKIKRLQKIQSINFGGKVNKTVQDMGDKWKDFWSKKIDKSKEMIKKTGDYVLDKMDQKQLQEFLSAHYPVKIKLGKYKKVDNKNGGMYKFLAGLPEDKSYECGYVFRNGNDIRIYPHGEQFPISDANNPDLVKEVQAQALEWFDAEDPEEVKNYY